MKMSSLLFVLMLVPSVAFSQSTRASVNAKSGIGAPLSIALEYKPASMWLVGGHVGWDLFRQAEGGLRAGIEQRWRVLSSSLVVGPTLSNNGDHEWGCGFGLGSCSSQRADTTFSLDANLRIGAHFDFGMFLLASAGVRNQLVAKNCSVDTSFHPDDSPQFSPGCGARIFPRFGFAAGFEF